MVGVEKEQAFGMDWRLNVKAHGGISDYTEVDKKQPVAAFESQYSGEVKSLRLSGNYYYSSPYFPGNRRGLLQIQQNATLNLPKNKTAYASFFLSDFSPRSYAYPLNVETKNLRFDTGISFPRKKQFAHTLGLQYQLEEGNNFIAATQDGFLDLSAVRMLENLSWLSSNLKHSVILGMEGGFMNTSDNPQWRPQLKLNAIYSFKWLNATALYQYGSFFLSEYPAVIPTADPEQAFNRLMFSLSTDHRFLDNKLNVKSGAVFIHDAYAGQTPSAFVNLQYKPNTLMLYYLNTSWFKYDERSFGLTQRSMLMVEAGITINFKGTSPHSGRKGNLSASVYYDTNSNEVWDKDEQAAPDYLVTLNKTAFKTDEAGELTYKGLPFGTYSIQPIVQKGWFSKTAPFTLDTYRKKLLIPLQQNGSMTGRIQYDYDPKTALSFEPQASGVRFKVLHEGVFIQRVSTDDEGHFNLFLPTGSYQIQLDETSLPEHAFVEETIFNFEITSGKITNIPDFIIKVKEKKINVKRFGF